MRTKLDEPTPQRDDALPAHAAHAVSSRLRASFSQTWTNAQFLQSACAYPFRIALAKLGYQNDLLGDKFGYGVLAVNAENTQSVFISCGHARDGFRAEAGRFQ